MANLQPINIPASFWQPQEFLRALKDGRAHEMMAEIVEKIDELNLAVERTCKLKEVDSLLLKTQGDREAAAIEVKRAKARAAEIVDKASREAEASLKAAKEQADAALTGAKKHEAEAKRAESLAKGKVKDAEALRERLEEDRAALAAQRAAVEARDAEIARRLGILERALQEARAS